jgi:hypothetical protein
MTKSKLYLTFLDLKKAFDSVQHNALLDAFKYMGIDKNSQATHGHLQFQTPENQTSGQRNPKISNQSQKQHFAKFQQYCQIFGRQQVSIP